MMGSAPDSYKRALIIVCRVPYFRLQSDGQCGRNGKAVLRSALLGAGRLLGASASDYSVRACSVLASSLLLQSSLLSRPSCAQVLAWVRWTRTTRISRANSQRDAPAGTNHAIAFPLALNNTQPCRDPPVLFSSVLCVFPLASHTSPFSSWVFFVPLDA